MHQHRANIYYMSGTGNSYRLACLVDEELKKAGYLSHIKSTREADVREEISGNPGDFLVLAFPTHGFTVPWEMLKFACRLPPKKLTKAFCIATRGSLKASKVLIPGMSGSANFIIALILILKGYRVLGALSQNMPSNWSTLHPIQKTSSHQAIIDRARKRIIRFMCNILNNRWEWFNLNNLYEFVSGMLLLPISAAYLLFGRFYHSKLYFANKNCNQCGICVKNCPYQAIRLYGKKRPLPYWTYRCESCMRCATLCPENAIEIGQSWGVLVFYIGTIPFSVYFLNILGEHIGGIDQIRGTFYAEIIEVLFWYPSIFIPYFIFQLFLRIPIVNWIFTHTTMTHFKWWGRYREPGTRLKEI
jgi:Pyruvate/2-oxoacid:ferredoxin oxidoreductase delta subunit